MILVLACGLLVTAALVALLVARPWLAPWGIVFLFGTTSELRVRIADVVGVTKDAYVALLLGLAVLAVVRGRTSLVARFPPLAIWAPMAVLLALYLVDLGGEHGVSWLFGTRLLVETVLLLLIGLTAPDPDRTLRHLVLALSVFLPLEAALAWVQQAVGPDALVRSWGYAFGSQVRLTSGGGLRSPGTYEEAFALASHAVVGACVAATVASRRCAALLWVSVAAVLAATQVRTAALQVAVLLLVVLVRRGQVVAAAVSVVAVGAAGLLAAGVFLTSSTVPGGPVKPLLFTLNGRFDAWAVAYEGPGTLVRGNGVGAVGSGSTRAGRGVIAQAPRYDPERESEARFAGDPAFIDSSWGQVLSDVGLVGVAALGLWVVAFPRWVLRASPRGSPSAWLVVAVVAVSVTDWVSRTTMASYPTGFTTFYVLGLGAAAGVAVRRPRVHAVPRVPA